MSFFECCGNGFRDQPFLSGSISPFCIADVRERTRRYRRALLLACGANGDDVLTRTLVMFPDLNNHVCIGGSEVPEWLYVDEPLPGELLYFLFSAAGDCGEGGLGAGRPWLGCAP